MHLLHGKNSAIIVKNSGMRNIGMNYLNMNYMILYWCFCV